MSEDARVDPRLEFLERLKAKTDARRAQVETARLAVAEVTGEATSPDRLVTVKVSPQGALLDLTLDDEALDLHAADLAALVLATARTATEQAAAAMQAAVAPLEEPLDVAAEDAGADDAAAADEVPVHGIDPDPPAEGAWH